MKKFKKVCLWIIGISVLLIVLVAILPSPKSSEVQKLTAQRMEQRAEVEEVKKVKEEKRAKVSPIHQQIISKIKWILNRDLKDEDYDWRLKKVEIEDKVISVYLDLQFKPPSKSWVRKEGLAWLNYVAITGLEDDKGNFPVNVYETGYNIRVSLWTYVSPNEVIPWGHATLFNSGKPFTMSSVSIEGKWMDGAAMKMLK